MDLEDIPGGGDDRRRADLAPANLDRVPFDIEDLACVRAEGLAWVAVDHARAAGELNRLPGQARGFRFRHPRRGSLIDVRALGHRSLLFSTSRAG
jgi:hypothetical protein